MIRANIAIPSLNGPIQTENHEGFNGFSVTDGTDLKVNCYKKASRGFTLLEATIALSIWMLLSLGIILIWQHASSRSEALLSRQNAFENARGSMDAIIMNIQMAHTIRLEVGHDYTLERLTLTERDPQGRLHNYIFYFDINAPQGTPKFNRLEFGLNNEFASGIALVRIEPVGYRHINITIHTDCLYPVILEGSVDIRYKALTIVYLAN